MLKWRSPNSDKSTLVRFYSIKDVKLESLPIYGAKTNGISAEEAINNPSLIEKGSIIRPAYEGKYKVQGEIKTDRNFRIKATVSRDTGLADMLLQEVYLEDDESLASKEVSVTTVYGLVAFDSPCSIGDVSSKRRHSENRENRQ